MRQAAFAALADTDCATEHSPSTPAVIFGRAAVRRVELDLGYAGAVTPPEAWALLQQGAAALIDVRTAPEFKFVGRVPETTNVEWHGSDAPPLLICRSGVRSHAAASAATKAGFRAVYNVLEGFEGRIDARQQRGRINGWRRHDLPWVQD